MAVDDGEVRELGVEVDGGEAGRVGWVGDGDDLGVAEEGDVGETEGLVSAGRPWS